MASDYPLDNETTEERISTTVRLPNAIHEDVELVAELWNEFDRVRGVKRRRKWKASSVMATMVRGGLQRFWESVGGRPPSKEGRAEFARKAVAQLKAEQDKKKK